MPSTRSRPVPSPTVLPTEYGGGVSDAASSAPAEESSAALSPEDREEWSDHNIPKTGPGNGDSRLTPEGRAALLALVENDDFGKYLDDVCSDESSSLLS